MLYRTMATVLDGWRGDLSLRELARRTGRSDVAIADILNGKAIPRPETVAAICDALGRTEADLMREMAQSAEG